MPVVQPDTNYFDPLWGANVGVPDPGDPIARAQLQESVMQAQIEAAHQPGAVPYAYGVGGYSPNWSQQPGIAGQLPRPGWTAQQGGSPFLPYTEPVGQIPDWTGDPNGIGAGRWDMNEVWPNPQKNSLNQAPLGVVYDNTLPNDVPNPNAPTTDVTGTGGELEY